MVAWVDRHGHWQTLIGLDKMGTESPYNDVMIHADPYDITEHCQDSYYIYPFERVFSMWREGISSDKSLLYEQPFAAAWPSNQ